jgi:hypothetical protein
MVEKYDVRVQSLGVLAYFLRLAFADEQAWIGRAARTRDHS